MCPYVTYLFLFCQLKLDKSISKMFDVFCTYGDNNKEIGIHIILEIDIVNMLFL
jgi:hypothetical protein